MLERWSHPSVALNDQWNKLMVHDISLCHTTRAGRQPSYLYPPCSCRHNSHGVHCPDWRTWCAVVDVLILSSDPTMIRDSKHICHHETYIYPLCHSGGSNPPWTWISRNHNNHRVHSVDWRPCTWWCAHASAFLRALFLLGIRASLPHWTQIKTHVHHLP